MQQGAAPAQVGRGEIEPHLRTEVEIQDLFPRMEKLADKLCQTSGLILWALEAPATCYGAYENRSGVTGSCDEHCGHGNEDGWCKRNDEWRVLLAEADKKPAPEKPPPASGPSPDALLAEALDAPEALLGWQTLAPVAEVDKARAVLRRGGR